MDVLHPGRVPQAPMVPAYWPEGEASCKRCHAYVRLSVGDVPLGRDGHGEAQYACPMDGCGGLVDRRRYVYSAGAGGFKAAL